MASKNQRVLLMVNSLSRYAVGIWQFIYSFAENSAITIAQNLLGDDYKSITVRKGTNATRAKFLTALQAAATTPGVRAVDVFLQLHGSEGRFIFHDASVAATVLRDEILALGLPDRLRLLYNTGCYGDSQNRPAMMDAGFETAIGSADINCTGAVEFPAFCSMWQNGKTVTQIMAVADNPVARAVQDGLAKATSPTFRNADSKKTIRGNRSLTISS
jgi:hypothetical protein